MSVQDVVASGPETTLSGPGGGPATSRQRAEYLLLRDVAEGTAADGAALVARHVRAGLAGPAEAVPGPQRFGRRSGRPIRRPVTGADVGEVSRVVVSSRMLSLLWRQVHPNASDQ